MESRGIENKDFSPVEKSVAEPPEEPVEERVRGAQPKYGQEAPSPGSVPATVEKASSAGIAFRIIGGARSEVKHALKQALEKAARPLVESGVAGWTLTLELDRIDLTHHEEASVPMVACQLTAEVNAERPESSIDLGPVTGINSQTNGSQACVAATGPLARDVITRFVDTLSLSLGQANTGMEKRL